MDWINKFSKHSIFFITPDIKRGVGFEDILPKYHIVCSFYDPIIPSLRKKNAKIFCLEEAEISGNIPNNTGLLLDESKVKKYIKNNSKSQPKIAYFKPSLKIDSLINENNYQALGNSYQLNEKFENKINLVNLEKIGLSSYLLPSQIGRLINLKFLPLTQKFALPFVIQFGHGWAGKTTFVVKDEKDFLILINKYPQTTVKVCSFINGFSVLNNCCIYNRSVIIGPPAHQINGIKKLSSKNFATCGRQWPAEWLQKETAGEIELISQKIGNYLSVSDFRGFFGIDFLLEEGSSRIFITEINARLTASSSFYTKLERTADSIPLLAYHYGAFLDEDLDVAKDVADIYGSQVIVRDKTTAAKITIEKFGVYESFNDKINFIKEDYQPEKLTGNQFIFHKSRAQNQDSELIRIETKNKVLKSPHFLSEWLDRIVSG